MGKACSTWGNQIHTLIYTPAENWNHFSKVKQTLPKRRREPADNTPIWYNRRASMGKACSMWRNQIHTLIYIPAENWNHFSKVKQTLPKRRRQPADNTPIWYNRRASMGKAYSTWGNQMHTLIYIPAENWNNFSKVEQILPKRRRQPADTGVTWFFQQHTCSTSQAIRRRELHKSLKSDIASRSGARPKLLTLLVISARLSAKICSAMRSFDLASLY